MSYIQGLRSKIGKDPIFSPGTSIIVYENNKYLLQFRKDFQIWGLHGGAMELGENFKEAALRELKEETDLDVVTMNYFKTYAGEDIKIIYPNGDIVYPVVMGFIVSKTEGQPNQQHDEVSDLKWFDEEDLPIEDMMMIDKKFLKDFIQYKNSKNKMQNIWPCE
ncbi:NUDIX hydrolase [Candidatus Phytoplasma pruni]|uniref:NUDIX domain-containing protein n=1 Tax=Candidatus Phytoplasma pruni TaxID=479893 RepID=A0A851HJX4_9MOLU|nr:NUDIX domain-containing protein [Candidatus Phytoplasma pruni]NWN45739.1 NUDIX domain-containing protein [Candidatus Phytoplasma pruni]